MIAWSDFTRPHTTTLIHRTSIGVTQRITKYGCYLINGWAISNQRMRERMQL